ncbi:AAA family ATPase [uncultured Amnibacterium sp.]|uniref:AAA family ATPase n=1 Tax=uncultured Amnibacterium sp. TaxID=1631851 RepID=UPI0035C9C8C3
MSRVSSGAEIVRLPSWTDAVPSTAPQAPVGRTDALVGRAGELSDLQRFIDDRSEPVLLLAGPRGSGRTSLIRGLHELRPEQTVLVRSRTVATSHPWTGFATVLSAIDESSADLLSDDAPQPEIGSREHLLRTLGLIAAVKQAAVDPVVVLIDDLDLQDEESQDAIAMLAVRLAGSLVRVLAGITWPAVHERYADLPTLRLDPLSEEDLRSIAGALPDRRIDPVTTDLVARLSGGVPGVLTQHLERLTPAQRSGGAPLTVPLPAAYPRETAIAQVRLGLEAEEWQQLQRIATAPIVSMQAVPELLQPEPEHLEHLIARGLVTRESGFVSIPLPELRSQLYWEMTSATRRAAHAAAADAEASGDPDLRDWHRSHLVLDATTSSSLYAAAASMLRKGQTAGALEVAERALGLAGVVSPVQQQLEFARELLLHGCAELTSRHLPSDRAVMTRRQAFQRARLELVVRASIHEDLAMEAVDALVGRYRIDLPEECADLLSLAGLLLLMDGALEEGVQRVHAAGLLSTPDPDGRSLHHWVERLSTALRSGSRGDRPVRHERVPADADVEIRVAAALALMWEERNAAAREHLAILMSGWHGARSLWSVRAQVLAVENELRAGEIGRAIELADRLERSPGPRSFIERTTLAWIALQQQRFDDAEALIRSCEDDSDLRRRRTGLQSIARLRGTAALLQGDPAGAAARLRSVVEARSDVNPALLWVHPDLVEALWRTGDRDGAVAIADRLAQGVARAPSRWGTVVLARCRAMVADDVEAAFTEALLAFDGAELPFERARTHGIAGLAAARAGITDMAREEQQASAEAFSRLGATAWAELIRSPSAPGVGATREMPSLTDTELAVLRMARRGAQNREIAAALFMSLRSVELRLTQIYRKFDARSRAHLFSLLPDGWPGDGRGGSGSVDD